MTAARRYAAVQNASTTRRARDGTERGAREAAGRGARAQARGAAAPGALRPAGGLPRSGPAERPVGLRAGREGPRGLVGEAGRRTHVVRALVTGARLVGGALRQVVRRWQAERLLQLPGPPRRGRPRLPGRLL